VLFADPAAEGFKFIAEVTVSEGVFRIDDLDDDCMRTPFEIWGGGDAVW